MSRFCPFCGLSNAPEYSFCSGCGKPLPPMAPAAATAPTPSAAGAFPVPPVVGTAPYPMPPAPQETFFDPGDEPIERPLTDAERSSLRQSSRFRNGNAARVFGTLMGITPLFLTMMAIGGTPFVPENFGVIVVATGFLAIVLGVAASTLRTPVNLALKAGQVSEARGVPEKRSDPSGRVGVAFGDLDFLMKPALANRLPDGQLAQLTFVVVGMERDPRSNRARAIVLGIDGQPTPPAEASLAVAPEVAQMLRTMGRPGAARRM